MPSATQDESPVMWPGKKRRRDEDSEVQVSLFSSTPSSTHTQQSSQQGLFASYNHQNNSNTFASNNHLVFHQVSPNQPASLVNMPRKIKSLPPTKRARVYEEEEDLGHAHAHPKQSPFPHAHPDYWTPPMSPQLAPQFGRSNNNTAIRPTEATTRTNSAAVLSACHICHRKPTKKTDLDSYADCTGCGQRTCYICIRECQGWLSSTASSSTSGEDFTEIHDQDLSSSFPMRDVDDVVIKTQYQPEQATNADEKGGAEGWQGRGHRSMICSRCCVERGGEGEVLCLGCLAGMEGA